MGRRFRNLYDQVIAPDNLRRAYLRAATGKRSTADYLAFKEHAEVLLDRLHGQLSEGTWQPLPPRCFTVYEPKARAIQAPRFADRVVHHALCAVIEPIFDATLLPTVFACRRGKGTHAGVRWVQSQLRHYQYRYFLHTDFAAYFASIDRGILRGLMDRKITCPRTRSLLDVIIPPDGVGLPIGALTSQLGANIYSSPLDYHLQHQLRVPFARYMDDIVVLGQSLAELRDCQQEIKRFAEGALGLRLSRWNAAPVSQGINFLGYRIWPHHKLLRRSSVVRAKRTIRQCAAASDIETLRRFVGSWRGHAQWADAHNLNVWLDEQYDLSRLVDAGPKRRPKSPKLETTLELPE